MTTLAVAVVVALIAATVQAVTGFGFALVAVPLVALAIDPQTAVTAMTITSLALTTTATVAERAHVRWPAAAALLAAALLGLPVGLLVLRYAPERALTATIAIVVLACTLLIWRGGRIGTGPVTVGAVGVLTGVLTTATGMNGPPVVAAFQAMGYPPRAFRATLAAVFAGTGWLALAGFGLTGALTAEVVRVGLAGMPAVAAGWWLGDRCFTRLDPARFRRVVLAALMASGAVMLARAVLG